MTSRLVEHSRADNVFPDLELLMNDLARLYADTSGGLSPEEYLTKNNLFLSHAVVNKDDGDIHSDSGSTASSSTSPNRSPTSMEFVLPPVPSIVSQSFDKDTEDSLDQVIQLVNNKLSTTPNCQVASQIETNTNDFSSGTSLPYYIAASRLKDFMGTDEHVDFYPHISPNAPSVDPSHTYNQRSSATLRETLSSAEFQPSGHPSPSFSTIQYMPGISPPHLTAEVPKHCSCSALAKMSGSPTPVSVPHSPTFSPVPKLERFRHRTDGKRGENKESDIWATYLVRQRQRARLTITRAASLAEPKDLILRQPKVYHASSCTPRTSRIGTGAYGRRVNIAPKILAKGWEPWRKGGVLDRANLADARRRERLWQDALRAEETLEATDQAEAMLPAEQIWDQADVADDHDEELSGESGAPRIDADPKMANAAQASSDGKDDRKDEDLLIAALIATMMSSSSPSSGEEPDAMQVYVDRGSLVTPSEGQVTNGTHSENTSGSLVSKQMDIKSVKQPNKYIPQARSPLSQSFVVPLGIKPTRTPGGTFSMNVWRRLTRVAF